MIEPVPEAVPLRPLDWTKSNVYSIKPLPKQAVEQENVDLSNLSQEALGFVSPNLRIDLTSPKKYKARKPVKLKDNSLSLEEMWHIQICPEMESFLLDFKAQKNHSFADFLTLIACLKKLAYDINPMLHVIDQAKPYTKVLVCTQVTKSSLSKTFDLHKSGICVIEELAEYLFKGLSQFDFPRRNRSAAAWFIYNGEIPCHLHATLMKPELVRRVAKSNVDMESISDRFGEGYTFACLSDAINVYEMRLANGSLIVENTPKKDNTCNQKNKQRNPQKSKIKKLAKKQRASQLKTSKTKKAKKAIDILNELQNA